MYIFKIIIWMKRFCVIRVANIPYCSFNHNIPFFFAWLLILYHHYSSPSYLATISPLLFAINNTSWYGNNFPIFLFYLFTPHLRNIQTHRLIIDFQNKSKWKKACCKETLLVWVIAHLRSLISDVEMVYGFEVR